MYEVGGARSVLQHSAAIAPILRAPRRKAALDQLSRSRNAIEQRRLIRRDVLDSQSSVTKRLAQAEDGSFASAAFGSTECRADPSSHPGSISTNAGLLLFGHGAVGA